MSGYGSAKESGNISSIDKIWELNIGSAVYSDIAAFDIDGDGKKELLIVTDEGTLFAIDDSGNILWKFESGEQKERIEDLFLDKESIKVRASSPVCYDLNGNGSPDIIFGSESGKLFVVNNKGKKLFEFSAGESIRSTAAIADVNNDGSPEIIFGSSDSHLYILDSDGKLLRKFATGGEIESGITIADLNNDGSVQMVFGCEDNNLYVLDFDGNIIWKFQANGPIKSTPTIASMGPGMENMIIFGCDDGTVYVLRNNGSVHSSYNTSGRVVSKVITADLNNDSKVDIIASTCSYDDNVVVLSNDGNLIDSFSAGFWVVSTPVFAGNSSIIFGSYDHHLYIVGAPKGDSRMKSRVKMFDTGGIIVSTPAVIDDNGKSIIVTGNDKGDVFALRHG